MMHIMQTGMMNNMMPSAMAEMQTGMMNGMMPPAMQVGMGMMVANQNPAVPPPDATNQNPAMPPPDAMPLN